LQRRYRQLVMEHLHAAHPLAAGPAALPGTASAFASTQAAGRFYANPRVTLPQLAQPLRDAARTARRDGWALVVHDQSVLAYPRHASKTDQRTFGPEPAKGYALAAAVLVDADRGDPVAPLELRGATAEAVFSTRPSADDPDRPWPDELGPTMAALAAQGLADRLVHVLDREADSVGHCRDWAGAGHWFLVRADAEPQVRWDGADLRLAQVGQRLAQRQAFRFSRAVAYHGQPARQEIAEAVVVLTRPAWRCRTHGRKRVKQRLAGPPLALRLIVSRVLDAAGRQRAEWLLLTNLPAEVSAARIALWYYWRWRIESYVKLLKSAGFELGRWQQESGEALAKRLLVVSMACVVVWRLAGETAPAAAKARRVLVRRSGRQMPQGREFTLPALLAGLWVLLGALALLAEHPPAEVQALAHQILGGWSRPPPGGRPTG
jgi:hypothetical protein